MAQVLFYHVVGDLTIGKPKLQVFLESSSVGEALQVLQKNNMVELSIWRSTEQQGDDEQEERTPEKMQERFLGILDMVDIVGHMASEKYLKDPEGGLSVSVSEIVIPNNALLKQVAPATRLFDAMDLLKQGVRQLLVPLIPCWRSVSKRFSMLYFGRWIEATQTNNVEDNQQGYCILTTEDLVRFLMGHMGALSPLPLMTIEALGAINKKIATYEARGSMWEALYLRRSQDTDAVAVVERIEENEKGWRIVGEISAFKLTGCNFQEAVWAMAGASSVQDFLLYMANSGPLNRKQCTGLSSFSSYPSLDDNQKQGASLDNQKQGSSSIYLSSNTTIENHPRNNKNNIGKISTFYCIGVDKKLPTRTLLHRQSSLRKGVLMETVRCRPTQSLAGVMAQLLTYRETHVWVIDEDDGVIGMVSYGDIIKALLNK